MTSETIKVLIVEDDETNLLVAKLMVGLADCHAVCARNPKEAIDLFKRENPQLILLDLGLPQMDGYQLASEIRSLETDAARAVPIVAVTAYLAKDHKQRCREAGFAAFLTKPVEIDNLLSTIRRLTSLHHCLEAER